MQNPLPVINSLTPAQAVAGTPGITLTIYGSGFIEASQVLWNGEALPTTYANSTSLQAEVDSHFLSYASVAGVTVLNPEPSGGLSPQANFIINLRGRILLPVIER